MAGGHVKVSVVATGHPLLPKLSDRDIVLICTTAGWRVENAAGRQMCETLASIAEARLIARTVVPDGGRVWVAGRNGWTLMDED